MARSQTFIQKLVKRLPFVPSKDPVVTVLELKGAIGDFGFGARRALTFAGVEKRIKQAFAPSRLSAVALVINSPGGSPVQSRLILRAIRRQAKDKNVPVFAFVEDVAASGGYILALGADEILADASSIIGSIGVISAGFGFQEAIAKIGVERRVHTAGRSKSQLDPFQPEKDEDVARLKTILDDMHVQFIDLVKERRGAALTDDDDLFSGRYWTAAPALERGLIDGIAHLDEFLEARFGEDVKLKKVETPGSLVGRLLGKGQSARGAAEADAVLGRLEERALWARFGL